MRMRLAVLTVVALAAVQSAAQATVINYVANGSFETYSVSGNVTSFPGWTISTSGKAVGPGYGPEVGYTDGATKNRYGDIEKSDNATTPDPNAAGTHALYLVDDVAMETLTQTVYLPHAGVYEVGFDGLATGSGVNNAHNATLLAVMAGVTVVSGSATMFGTNSWTHESANATITEPGYYTIDLTFQGGAQPAKDIMIDQVYIDSPSTLSGGGVVVPAPEPGTVPVIAAAIGGLVALRRRRR